MSAYTTTTPSAPDSELTGTIIWCHPRSCSTAFERAFIQRSHIDHVIFHEPTGDFAYYARDRTNFRFAQSLCETEDKERYERSLEQVLLDMLAAKGKDAKGKKYIFVKDMAQYILPRQTLQALHPDSKVYNPAGKEFEPASDAQQMPSAYVRSSLGADASVGQLREAGAKEAASLASAFTSARASNNTLDLTIASNPTLLPTPLLRRFKHTFLIREPSKSVPSYYKCCQDRAGGFEYFDGAEAGYKELAILHSWISNRDSTFHTSQGDREGLPTTVADFGKPVKQPMPPPLIDATVLLAYPNHVVQQYCEAIDIPFMESMMSWESAASPAQQKPLPLPPTSDTAGKDGDVATNGSTTGSFAKWGAFHAAAEKSTGFGSAAGAAQEELQKQAQKQTDLSLVGWYDREALSKKLEADVLETIDASIAAYRYLYSNQSILAPAKA